jgi:mono/diheme cytochrome c family protein
MNFQRIGIHLYGEHDQIVFQEPGDGYKKMRREDTMSNKIVKLIVCLIILAFALPVFAYTTEQASNGKALYARNCAVCHGANGEGGRAPAVAGPGYLPKMKTAGQAYDFARENMPANKPGSLKNDEYLDIISFVLQANNVPPDGKPLTPASANKIKLADGEK